MAGRPGCRVGEIKRTAAYSLEFVTFMPRLTESSGVRACGKTCATPGSGVAATAGVLDAPGWTTGRTATAVVAENACWSSSQWDAESSGPGFQHHDTQHQMGDQYHRHSDCRALVVSLCRAGFVFRTGRMVDESAAEPPAGRPSGADGLMAAARSHPSHSALRSGVSVTSEEYQRFLEAHQEIFSMSAVGSCADNAAAESFFGVLKRERVHRQHHRTRAEARADIFDYIERWHNPRQQRRLE